MSSRLAAQILGRLCEDPDPVVRWHAALALGEVGGREPILPLRRLLRDEVPFVRGHAAIALAQIGDLDSLAAIRQAAASEPHEKMKGVIEAAAQTLERLWNPSG